MHMYCLYIEKKKSYFHFAEECPQGIYIVNDYSMTGKDVHNILLAQKSSIIPLMKK